MEMATIKDVAKLAKVSTATVSRVINNSGYVHADTRKRVEEAIRQLNYRPNAVARSLFKKESKSIGFIIPDITNPFFPQLVRAVEDTIMKAGYTILLFNTDGVLDYELQLIELMKSKYVDGILAVSNSIKREHLQDLTIPIVSIDRVIDPDLPSVSIDNYDGAKQAVRHLLAKGCRKIAHLSGPENIDNARERCQGYLDEMKRNNMHPLVYPGNYELKEAMNAVLMLLTEHPDVDGIFAGNDVMAVGTIKAATKLGYKIPEDIKVIGFDGIDIGMTITPELTTMEQPILEMGRKGSELLLDLIHGKKIEQKRFVYQAKLVERHST